MKKTLKLKDIFCHKRRICYVLVTGFLLALTFVLGYQMQTDGMTSLGVKGKLFIILISGAISICISPLVNLWFRLLDKKKAVPQADLSQLKSGRIFLISWAAILLCWIPVFLAYYPAIMSYDFNRQSIEAYQGYIWFNTHHPLIHTFLIRCAFLIGETVGSYQVGMAVLCVFQMLVLSAVMAYSCSMIGRLTKRKWPVAVTVILFGILPVYSVLALAMTKDILFSAFFLLFILLVLERKLYRDGGSVQKGKTVLLDAALVMSGVLMILFRNNAVYAFAVFALFYILWSKRERVRILLLCVLILAGGMGAKEGIRTAMDAGSGSGMEMYSVFVQQMCRVAVNHESTLSEEEWRTINKYVPHEFWMDYNPTIADSIKANIATTSYMTWKEDIPGMLKDWAKLGIKYPNDYIDAFLALTMGYWYLDDVSHAEVLGYGEDTGFGLIYTFNGSASGVFEGIENHSYFPGLLKICQKIVNGNCYQEWPVVSLLFKPAFYCWIMLLVMISLWYRKERSKLVLCMLPFWYLMTLFLGPVVNIRYVYPFMIASPFLLAWLFGRTGWDAGKNGVVNESIPEKIQ